MPSPLEQWQTHSERHFETLARSRSDASFPIFALEHGLTTEQVEDIAVYLRLLVTQGNRLSPYWLLWVIYATERGYAYTGGEYWRSFEELIPGWELRDRYKMARWFSKFHKTYNGVTPTGPWAEHFRIIAWPITHAILPRYLQRQFAKTLYDLRYPLGSLDSDDPLSIGRLIAAKALRPTTRFEEFLQQEELVGRITLALLHREANSGPEPILPSTLARIVSDLERVRHAREWLSETGRVVTERFKGIGRGAGPREAGAAKLRHAPVKARRPNIRPGLVLRYAGGDAWSAQIEIPSFQDVAALGTEVKEFLQKTRCLVNGSDAKRPAGWLLSGRRRAALQYWPDPDQPLISFERSKGSMDHLLESECRMKEGPVWLFKVGIDGTAREITGGAMRPGGRYIIAHCGEQTPPPEGMRPCTISCQGISAFMLSMPQETGAAWTEWSASLGLELARTVRVWPAGLPGRNWDGEGSSEWLTTETPCLGIASDHPVDSYAITLDESPETYISAQQRGWPIFVRLSRLEPGVHLFKVRARRKSSTDQDDSLTEYEGFMELKVRDPEPWAPGTSFHSGLVVSAEPHDARLDAFWQNQVRFRVLGPESRSVSFSVSLQNSQGEELIHEQIGAPMELPVKPKTWQRRFAEFLDREDIAWRYLEASAGTLKIDGEDLGEFTFTFEHEALPLRWILHQGEGKVVARLVDDTAESDAELKCRIFPMESPDTPRRCDPAGASVGLDIDPPGALLLAQKGQYYDLIMVSAGLGGEGLKGLGVNPHFDSITDAPSSLVRALRIFKFWRDARRAGFLADVRGRQITDGFLSAFYCAVGGVGWAKAERCFLDKIDSQESLDDLQHAVTQRGGFASVLRRDAASIEGGFESVLSWFADLAQRYAICDDKALCEFALRFAGHPHKLRRIYKEELKGCFGRLNEHRILMRGARLVALVQANDGRKNPRMTPGWK